MKKIAAMTVRVAVTVAILTALILVISPQEVVRALRASQWPWLVATTALMPLFLFLRIVKWHILVRPISRSLPIKTILRGYLWGMAVGLVTPGRAGELARIWASGLPTRCVGLFLAEKLLEIGSIFLLCLASLTTVDMMPRWLLLLCGLAILALAASWRHLVRLTLRLPYALLGPTTDGNAEDLLDVLTPARLVACGLLSMLCQIVFCMQSYLMFNSMGHQYDLLVVRFVPLVLLANLVPITIGGVGLRETVGVLVLGKEGMTPALVATGLFIVTVVDLFVPAVAGALAYMFSSVRPGSGPEVRA